MVLEKEYNPSVRLVKVVHRGLIILACKAVVVLKPWPEDTWRDENEVLTRLLKLNLALTADEKPIG